MHDTVINWLIEEDNPAVRYRTLTELCGRPAAEAEDSYASVWQQKSIVKMLQKQDENGLWSSKDWGGHTPLRYLTAFAEHGVKQDKRLDRFVDHTVGILQSAADEGDLAGCAGPLTLRALVMMGYGGREDVMALISAFSAAQLRDGGFICKRLLDKKPLRKSCFKAAFAGLLLYAECSRKGILPGGAEELVGYFLKRNVFYYQGLSLKDGRPGWRFTDNFFPVEPMRMGLPLIAAALAVLGAGEHPAMGETWALLKEKQDENGKYHLEGTLVKQPCSFGKVGQSNKWVTFYALLAQKNGAKI
ncbi:MAG: hypothetical protein FWE80_07665 [Oscillospiraceae bacterium]|nr:hypothetical protein [Oscillospiraceae bacterium]